MDIRSAELTKYAANAMLATKISFMNELAAVAERVGADIEKVRIGIGSDPRIGYSFIYPGIGYGGSCFPKDVKALIRSAHTWVTTPSCCDRSKASMNGRKPVLVNKLRTHFQDQLAARLLRSGAWPSSPIPMTCARRPAASSSMRCWQPEPQFAPTIRWRAPRRENCTRQASQARAAVVLQGRL
jgi:UDPglucose 6-dehydrogenase